MVGCLLWSVWASGWWAGGFHTAYAETQYTVTYSPGEHGFINGSTTELVTPMTSPLHVPEIEAYEHYTFIGWRVENSTGALLTAAELGNLVITKDILITAHYTAETLTVYYNQGSRGALSGTESEQVAYGASPLSVPQVIPEAGYTFIGWSSDGGGSRLTTEQLLAIAVTENVTYTACYVQSYYMVRFLSGEHGTFGENGAVVYNVTHQYGEYLEDMVKVKPDPGYMLDYWSSDGGATRLSTQEIWVSPVTQSVTYTVYYKTAEYKIVYSAGIHGAVHGATEETVTYGQYPAMAPQPVPDEGYFFTGWSTDGGLTLLTSEEASHTAITANTSYLAFFETYAEGLTVQSYGVISSAGVATQISVKPAILGGNKLVYWNFGSSLPDLPLVRSKASGYTLFPREKVIAAVSGDIIAVAELDPWDRIIRYGYTAARVGLDLGNGAPVLYSAASGNEAVRLVWSAVSGAEGYKLCWGTASGEYTTEELLEANLLSWEATGLNNGTDYYFAVKAVYPAGDSVHSNELSAVPAAVPLAPGSVSAVAGNGQAVVSFVPSAYDGGAAITQYEVTSYPGSIVATGSSSPITVAGLTNGMAYSFTVKAVNSAGKSAASASSGYVVPGASVSGGGGGGGFLASAVLSRTPSGAVDAAELGRMSMEETGGRQQAVFVLDYDKLWQVLEQLSPAETDSGPVVAISAPNGAEAVAGELTGEILALLDNRDAVLELRLEDTVYSLPVKALQMEEQLSRFGEEIQPNNLRIRVTVAQGSDNEAQVLEKSAAASGYVAASGPVSFSVTGYYGFKTFQVDRFPTFVQRRIALTEGSSAWDQYTGAVLQADGSLRPVPTRVEDREGRLYAVISSLTNSTYAVIRYQTEFADLEDHWARSTVNKLASRLILKGVDTNRFAPDQGMTRAEFAAVLTRALGLPLTVASGTKQPAFKDIQAADWFNKEVRSAAAYGLVQGYSDGSFLPSSGLTREAAMVMLARALKLAGGAGEELSAAEAGKLLEAYQDGGQVSDWARLGVAGVLKAGLAGGRTEGVLAPQDGITRGEVAVLLYRLLEKSGLS
jgi:uncharacterized repeat protein (TIGR02543 family)